MGTLDILALTSAGAVEPSLAIAACRAGARSFLDLQYTAQSPSAQAALERLARFAPRGFGVKLGPDAADLFERLVERPSPCREILLAGGEPTAFVDWIARLRRVGLRILLRGRHAR
jgi:hypothetical protein